MHERDSKRKIYAVFSASRGFAPRPPPGLRPWTPLGDFRQLCPPQPLTPGDATADQ